MPFLAVSEPLSGSRPRGAVQAVLVAVAGSALVAVAAHVAIPFWPVPMTLQTLAVMIVGAVCGPRHAFAVMIAYLIEGLAGLPVFAAGAGPAVLFGPTGGYLVGMVVAAVLTGIACRRGWLATPLTALTAFLAADAAIFAFGLARLAGPLGLDRALDVGLRPFLLGEALKLALATTLVTAFRREGMVAR